MLEELKGLLKHKKSNSYYAEKLGISVEEVKKLKKQISKVVGKQALIEDFVRKVNVEKGTLESSVETTFEPKDDIELAELHKIDLNKYKISTYWSKLKPNGHFTSSVLASLKKPEDYSAKDFAKFLETYEPPKVLISTVSVIDGFNREEVDAVLSIADFHLAKKTLEGESIQDKKNHYISVVTDLVRKASSPYLNLRKLVFVLSNDFFHTDNIHNQTTNGTPQETLVEYHNEYEEGFELITSTLVFLKQHFKEIEVVLVQGNHDRTKSFYFAHALEIFFKNESRITFQREHSITKCVTLGNTFIGFHHGNCKIDDLPLLFATGKDSSQFGNAKYREVHTGDKHHYMAKEIKGVRIQQMPSLSGKDNWHNDHNFVNNIRAGLILLYHPLTGKIGEFEARI